MPGISVAPGTQNPYVYVLNRPIGLTDPRGTAPSTPQGDPSSPAAAITTVLVIAGIVIVGPELIAFIAENRGAQVISSSSSSQSFSSTAARKAIDWSAPEVRQFWQDVTALSKSRQVITRGDAQKLMDAAKALGFEDMHGPAYDRFAYGFHMSIGGKHILVDPTKW